jgi:GT2 family glycosyltransferase
MISVIIVNYHSAHLIKRAVDSVFQENENIEVFIVDNTTTPEEQEHLCRIFDAEKINFIFNEHNVGFARACNQAFSLSRGDFIFLLNPDAYVIPPCLGILKEFMENTPRAGAVSPILYWDDAMTYLFPNTFPPSPVDDFLRELSGISPSFGYLYSHWGKRRNLKLWRSSLPVKAKNLSGGTVMVRRDVIEAVGGLFDERFFLFYEDNDLFLRLRKEGYRLYFVPHAKAVHRYEHSALKLESMAQSRELYYKKHFSNHFLRRIYAYLPHCVPTPEYPDSGSWSTPPSFSVPFELRKGYLFEWSPNHLFIPSVGFWGKGETFIFSEEIWHSLKKGDYYSRFSDDRTLFSHNRIFLWRKD